MLALALALTGTGSGGERCAGGTLDSLACPLGFVPFFPLDGSPCLRCPCPLADPWLASLFALFHSRSCVPQQGRRGRAQKPEEKRELLCLAWTGPKSKIRFLLGR